MSDTVDILVRAKEKLAAGWCQHATARNAQGALTELHEARRVCLHGALLCACDDDGLFADRYPRYRQAAAVLKAVLFGLGRRRWMGHLIAWNDAPGRTQAEVLDLFDAAIRLAKDDASDPPGRRARRKR